METVQQSSTVAALDIGSEKIAVAVADASEGGELTLLGFGKVPSLGIQHGSVQDVELAVESIRAAIAEAEQTSRRKVTTVSVALTGKHLHSINKVGQLVLPDAEVDSAAVKRVTRLAMAFDPKVEGQSQDDRLVSHVVKGYTLDNDDVMIDDPIGMVGSVIKAHVHLAIGSDSVVQNLVKCIRRAGLDIEGLVLQPWASAAGVLTPTDKELGVVVLDIGMEGMDGFEVMPMSEAARVGEIFCTVTGCRDIITAEHFPLMRDGAILSNAGHFDVEIDMAGLEEYAVRKYEARHNISGYELPNGNTIFVLGDGRLVNLACADGHPAEIMDMSFAIQALSAEYLARHRGELKAVPIKVPAEIDDAVARRKLASLGVEIDGMTAVQKEYMGV